MRNITPVLPIVGILVFTLGAAMMIPALYDLGMANADWKVFAISSCVTLFFGTGLFLTGSGRAIVLTVRQAFLLTTLSWILMTAFAAFPFVWSSMHASYTDAFFEAMSGITTTGSTVLTQLDSAPPGILLWRSMLNWLGGIGIVVMAIAVLPMLAVGGMQLFRMESSDTSDKILPRAAQIAGSISLLYFGLTLVCAIAYFEAGMNLFDAINHAMATLATGGFSTHDASIGHYDNRAIETVSMVFMIIGGMPFVLFLHILQGRPSLFFRDSQVLWYLGALVLFIYLAWKSQEHVGFEPGLLELHDAAFNIVSVMTTTGFATADYGSWGVFATTLFFVVTFVGGCTGSTSGGIKLFRFQVIYQVVLQRVRLLLYPSGIFIPKFNQKQITDSAVSSVMSFIFLYFLAFFVMTLAISLYGLDLLTSLSAAATALANVGPGLGDKIGPAGNFQSLPDGVKWILATGMLLGRLELFTVLVLMLPSFWRY